MCCALCGRLLAAPTSAANAAAASAARIDAPCPQLLLLPPPPLHRWSAAARLMLGLSTSGHQWASIEPLPRTGTDPSLQAQTDWSRNRAPPPPPPNGRQRRPPVLPARARRSRRRRRRAAALATALPLNNAALLCVGEFPLVGQRQDPS